MPSLNKHIPLYKEINGLFGAFSSKNQTKNPLFYCFRLRPYDDSLPYYKPPYKKGFYTMQLVTDSGNSEVIYNDTSATKLDSAFLFQAPGQTYSFLRDNSANGYMIYFKRECFEFFRPDFDTEFPFFNILSTNLFTVDKAQFEEFRPHFEYLFEMYEKGDRQNDYDAAVACLLALLYQFKKFTSASEQCEKATATPQKIIVKKFIQLVNIHYTDMRTVEEYASLLYVTPNHLSKSVKEESGKNALSFINERIMLEANSLVQFTDFSIAEIAHQLNFSDPANFGKFFKKHMNVTPVEFRKQSVKNK